MTPNITTDINYMTLVNDAATGDKLLMVGYKSTYHHNGTFTARGIHVFTENTLVKFEDSQHLGPAQEYYITFIKRYPLPNSIIKKYLITLTDFIHNKMLIIDDEFIKEVLRNPRIHKCPNTGDTMCTYNFNDNALNEATKANWALCVPGSDRIHGDSDFIDLVQNHWGSTFQFTQITNTKQQVAAPNTEQLEKLIKILSTERGSRLSADNIKKWLGRAGIDDSWVESYISLPMWFVYAMDMAERGMPNTKPKYATMGPEGTIADFENHTRKVVGPPKCTCGAHKLGTANYQAGHSTWCDVHESLIGALR